MMIKNVYYIAECSKNKKDGLGGVSMKRKLKVKKMLKKENGFSMVELLIGLLIIAVIAAASLTLLGGVLNTSKTKADQEAAETIKRAIEGYIHATNDTNLSAITTGTTTTTVLLERLAQQITLEEPSAGTRRTMLRAINKDTNAWAGAASQLSGTTVDATDVLGTFGPFLDVKKALVPQGPNMKTWEIHVNISAGSVLVKASGSASNNVTVAS